MTRAEIIALRKQAEDRHFARVTDADIQYRREIDRLSAQCKRHRFKPRRAIDCDDWKTECIYCGKTGRWL